MFDPWQIFAGASCTAFIAAVGFLVKRYFTGEGQREKATLLSTYASIAATMKSHGITEDDLMAELLFLLGDEEGSLLETAQRSWEKYREDHAAMAAARYERGSIQPLIWHSERESVTRQRLVLVRVLIEELKST